MVEDIGLMNRKRWFNSIRDYFIVVDREAWTVSRFFRFSSHEPQATTKGPVVE